MVIGAWMPADSIAWASSGTVSSDSTAWPSRSGISLAGTPSASSSPALRLREVGARAVATRSPTPARPTNVEARAPRPRASASTSVKMSAAAMPAAFRPCDSVAPAASAAAFFALPASSTPTGSLEASHTTRALAEDLGHPLGQRGRVGRAHEPGPALDHLARVRRAAHARDALGPERGLEGERRRRPVGRHEALRERHDARPRRNALAHDLLERLAQPGRRHGHEDQVGAVELLLDAAEHPDLQPLRQGDALEVALVLTRLVQLARLLLGAAQQRRAHAGAHEHDRDSRAEAAGADY